MKELRELVDAYEKVQKVRVSLSNQLSAIERGVDEHGAPELIQQVYDSIEGSEAIIAKGIKNIVETHPAWPWMSNIRGISCILGGKIIGLIEDIGKFDTVSKLWRFSGLAVIDGKREYNKPGEKSHYSRRMKTTMYLVASSFLRAGSPYRVLYDEGREKYEARMDEEGKPWTKGHQHNAAMRLMEKRFLSHLWLVWREAEGLPTREPYVAEKLGHTTIDDPWGYVNPAKVLKGVSA